MFVVGFTILGILILIVLYCVIKREKTLRNQLEKLKIFNLKSDPSSDSVIAKELQENQFDIKNVTSGKIHFNDLKTKGNDHINGEIEDPIQLDNDQMIAVQLGKNYHDIHEFTEDKLGEDEWKTRQ